MRWDEMDYERMVSESLDAGREGGKQASGLVFVFSFNFSFLLRLGFGMEGELR
jgi:hypothetical protein